MSKVIDYKIITSRFILGVGSDFCAQVNGMILDNWQPWGDVIVGKDGYCQVMVKYEEETADQRPFTVTRKHNDYKTGETVLELERKPLYRSYAVGDTVTINYKGKEEQYIVTNEDNPIKLEPITQELPVFSKSVFFEKRSEINNG